MDSRQAPGRERSRPGSYARGVQSSDEMQVADDMQSKNALKTARWTPESRAAHGAKTKESMADPAVRARIVAGMQASEKALLKQIETLNAEWRSASPAARSRFFRDILAPLWSDAE
jgi:hypothetical protein